ncbi:hypothetical protein LEP1GSC016_2003 [Leptospira borgpetersenii serovar Hardjo-bovis str. Sponselee]|uniref:Uncharacterized protein n=1 Tax=Leptospira borgpetersenii serovar Hardjo-bovis str. Sponselee TaxID=1303729 RepID=M6BTG6_LEPBO|nr:hypothetical protein B9T54_06525 [Leptospira borgpetersenii serovar Hardjo-bovis]AYR08187.1 hypothetical protein D1609_06435 [Leptospira borgpetersenii serovar Hardjo-bovis]EMJ83022.1 hypothetical protein LEP1GSC016_2003 [Leptospira borgpetersenii serovar Hardjo-bovis str. Sponselee]TQE51064.1 hypothetical protein FFZ95_15930 [Leptospira borgpetersenii]TQE52941.1 hypothetical protein FFZ96_15760 [Leptospira borgpetersenii]
MQAKAGFAQTFLQRVSKSRRAPIEARRFSFLLCQKDQAARFCPSFGTEPYIELTFFKKLNACIPRRKLFKKIGKEIVLSFRYLIMSRIVNSVEIRYA